MSFASGYLALQTPDSHSNCSYGSSNTHAILPPLGASTVVCHGPRNPSSMQHQHEPNDHINANQKAHQRNQQHIMYDVSSTGAAGAAYRANLSSSYRVASLDCSFPILWRCGCWTAMLNFYSELDPVHLLISSVSLVWYPIDCILTVMTAFSRAHF